MFDVIVPLLFPADAVFLILYKELYYRHIYAKVSVSNSKNTHHSLSIAKEPAECVETFPVFCCK